MTPREYSDPDGKIYFCWDTTQSSYLAAMIADGIANDSIITQLLLNAEDLKKKIADQQRIIANLEEDQQHGNRQNAILQEALKKANQLIKWLKLQARVFGGLAAAILLYSLTIGAQK